MKALPVYAIESVLVTLTRLEAEKFLTHPKAVQDIVRAALHASGSGKHGEEMSETQAQLPAPARSKKLLSGPTLKMRQKVECDECGRMIARFMMAHHLRIKHEASLDSG